MAIDLPVRLQEILDNPDQEADLAEAALLIAQQICPRIDVEAYLTRLRQIAATIQERAPADAGMQYRIQALNHSLFVEEGYRGNQSEYYDPRNSYLNDVLDRRLGIPITLSIIYISVGRLIGLPLHGVSFPGRFLVKFAWQGGEVFLDPYASGVSLDEAQLQQLLDDSFGENRQLLQGSRQLLAAAGKREILLRLLRNLKAIHLHNQADEPALMVLDLMLSIAPGEVAEVRDRAMVYDRLGYFRAALEEYRRCAQLDPQAVDMARIRTRIVELQQWEHSLH